MLNLVGDVGLDEEGEETWPAVVEMIMSALEAGGPPAVDGRKVPSLRYSGLGKAKRDEVVSQLRIEVPRLKVAVEMATAALECGIVWLNCRCSSDMRSDRVEHPLRKRDPGSRLALGDDREMGLHD